MNSEKHISLKRTVLYLPEEDIFCQCGGDFFKTCPLRAANNLPCQEAILGIHFIDRGGKEFADPLVRSLDEKFSDLEHSLRHLEDKLKVR